MKKLVDKLMFSKKLEYDEYKYLLLNFDTDLLDYANECAQKISLENFGNLIYARGLIEISNCCKNDCFYCGIRKSNTNVQRYRLSQNEIMKCCELGYGIGFRTFVLQGGEDLAETEEWIENVVKTIRGKYPDCAITLSLGEKNEYAYKRFFDAGANRYLLRHETYNKNHYYKLHPAQMSYEKRIKCLLSLKKIGYQTGTGIMVGSPFQTIENIVEDIMFMRKLNPEMIGIGPFLSHAQTPFASKKNGSPELTLLLISIFRLMFPKSLIPATTSLGTALENGRELGILAGANVVMPNLSPVEQRKKYELYDNKICLNEESAEGCKMLGKRIEKIGYVLSYNRGDYKE